MQVEFLGAVDTVTGSKTLVTAGKTRILVDCGLFQGLKDLRLRNWQELPFNPREIDAVCLTHAHIDHSGYLPLLVREGFRGPIYASAPTVDMCQILLPDSGRIQEEDAAYANRKGYSKHDPALPLYTENDAHAALGYFRPVPIREPVTIGELSVEFTPVGHILGATSVTVRHNGHSIGFSGDVGRSGDWLELEPERLPSCGTVVMESTYGDRCHDDADPIQELADLAKNTIHREGVLLIPSFAVGRTQMLLYCLHEAFRKGWAPRVPVYVNSPMATRVTNLYRRHADWHRLSAEQCQEVFSIADFISSAEESIALNRKNGPMIIISASGMLTGGRVLHHVRRFAPDSRNTILLPGFQAAGTRGAALLGGAESLKMFGEYVPIGAQVAHFDTLSAHADREGLLAWLGQCNGELKRVFVNHGEQDSAASLSDSIHERYGYETITPHYRQVFEVD